MSRSTKEWSKDVGVLAETSSRSSATSASATTKNGASRATSANATRSLRHQCRISSAAGSVTTMFFANMPATNSASAQP